LASSESAIFTSSTSPAMTKSKFKAPQKQLLITSTRHMDYYTKPFYNTSLNQSLYLQLNALKHTKNSQDFPTGTPDRRPPHRYNAHRIYSGFNATTVLLLSELSMQVQIKPIFKFQFQSSCLQIHQYIDIKELNTESRKLDFFQAVPQPFKLLAAHTRVPLETHFFKFVFTKTTFNHKAIIMM
jgi:hypothetical protein